MKFSVFRLNIINDSFLSFLSRSHEFLEDCDERVSNAFLKKYCSKNATIQPIDKMQIWNENINNLIISD
jgi:hypothetical protein